MSCSEAMICQISEDTLTFSLNSDLTNPLPVVNVYNINILTNTLSLASPLPVTHQPIGMSLLVKYASVAD